MTQEDRTLVRALNTTHSNNTKYKHRYYIEELQSLAKDIAEDAYILWVWTVLDASFGIERCIV